jgi:hypothetical protein
VVDDQLEESNRSCRGLEPIFELRSGGAHHLGVGDHHLAEEMLILSNEGGGHGSRHLLLLLLLLPSLSGAPRTTKNKPRRQIQIQNKIK